MPPGTKEKLYFVINGKKMAYEGFPEYRERDLFDLVVKSKLPEASIPGAYRENLPENAALSNADILQRLEAAKAAKAAKKAAKEGGPGQSEAPPQQQQPPPKAVPPAATAPAPATEAPPPRQESISLADSTAGDGFSAEYRQDLNTFIESVVNSDRGDLRAKIRQAGQPGAAPGVGSSQPPNAGGSPNPGAVQGGGNVPALQDPHPRRESYLNEDEASLASTGMRVPVYLYLEGSESTKVISFPSSGTFDDFKLLVEKKFNGQPLNLHFLDGEDKIDLDDDDTLQMFFYTQQAAPKLKILCTRPKAVTEDMMTKVQASERGQDSLASTRGGSSGGTAGEEGSSKPDYTSHATSTFTGHSGAVYCCCFAPTTDKFVSASRDKTVRLWNIADGTSQIMKGNHPEMVLSTDFSPDAEHIVSSSVDPTIKVWKASTCAKYLTMKGHTDKVYCTRFNDTGKHIASASCDRTVRVWSAVKGTQLAKLEGHTLMVFSCDFSLTDNGKFLASASEDRLVKIWDWEKGTETRSLIAHTGPVWSCRFSHDDRHLVSASMDNEVKIWDLSTGKAFRTFAGHRSPVHDACFSADGKYVFSCGRDFKILKWPVESGEGPNSNRVVEEFTGHTDIIYHIDVSKTKNQLLSCSLDQSVKLWNVQSA